MGKYEAINEAPIYVLVGDEDVLEEERDADDAMVSALPCFIIILFSLEINFRLYHVLNLFISWVKWLALLRAL